MSGATAAIATVLDICPIMRLDDGGHIIAYGKVRGKKNAIKETVRTMEQHAQGGVNYSGNALYATLTALRSQRPQRRLSPSIFLI